MTNCPDLPETEDMGLWVLKSGQPQVKWSCGSTYSYVNALFLSVFCDRRCFLFYNVLFPLLAGHRTRQYFLAPHAVKCNHVCNSSGSAMPCIQTWPIKTSHTCSLSHISLLADWGEQGHSNLGSHVMSSTLGSHVMSSTHAGLVPEWPRGAEPPLWQEHLLWSAKYEE